MGTHKYSRQREIIYDHLMSRCDHPTAEMIYISLKETDPKLSLGTVYRNLGLLSREGQICRISASGGPDRYDGNTASHGHFICKNCGSILDFPSEEADSRLRSSMQHAGRCADAVQITVSGLCRNCVPERLETIKIHIK